MEIKIDVYLPNGAIVPFVMGVPEDLKTRRGEPGFLRELTEWVDQGFHSHENVERVNLSGHLVSRIGSSIRGYPGGFNTLSIPEEIRAKCVLLITNYD